MIKFKEKEFGLPGLAAKAIMSQGGGMIASAGVSSVAGAVQNKKNMEQQADIARQQAAQQEKFQKEQMKQNEEFQKQNLKMQKEEQKIQRKAVKQGVNIGGSNTGMTTMFSVTGKSFSAASETGTFKDGFAPGMTAAMVGVEAVMGGKERKSAQIEHENTMVQNRQNFNSQMKSNKEMQTKSLEDQRAALDAKKAALKSGNFSEVEERSFAASPKFIQKLGQTVFEIGGTVKKSVPQKVATGLAMGVTTAGLGYAADRIITHDAKKNGLLPQQTPEQKAAAKEEKKKGLKKAALTAGALATTAFVAKKTLPGLARKGTFGGGFQNYYNKKAAMSPEAQKRLTSMRLKGFGNQVKHGFKEQFLHDDGRVNWIGTGLTTLFPAMTVAGYAMNKKNMNSQVNQSSQSEPQEQKTYSTPALGLLGKLKVQNALRQRVGTSKYIMGKASKFTRNIANSAESAAKSVSDKIKHENALRKRVGAGKYVLGKANRVVDGSLNVASQFAMGGGKKGVMQFRGQLKNDLLNSSTAKQALKNAPANLSAAEKQKLALDATRKNSYTADIVDFMGKHKKLAVGGSIAVGSVMMKPWTWGDKAVRGTVGLIDKDAFAYEKSQNQPVPQDNPISG